MATVASTRRRVWACSGATMAVLMLCCIGACRDQGKTRRAGTAADPWLVGMSQCTLGEPWRVQMNEDLKQAAARHPNLKLVFKDAQNDSLMQRAQVEELVAQQVDLLIVSPKEAAPLTKPVAEAYRRGIPVVVLDRAVQGDEYTVYIGADNRRIGRAAGEWAAQALGGQGCIVELKGLMTSTPGRDRHLGFREGLGLERHRRLQIVFEADMQWAEPLARKEMESALAIQPRIDLVYSHNDPGAHGAYLAARQAGRQHSMKLIGIDALPQEGLQYVRQRILSATFLYPTGGEQAIAAGLRLLRGESVPKQIVLSTRLFTPENVESGGREIP